MRVRSRRCEVVDRCARAVLGALVVVGLISAAAAADVPAPQLVGSTTLRLPATLEVVAHGATLYASVMPPAPAQAPEPTPPPTPPLVPGQGPPVNPGIAPPAPLVVLKPDGQFHEAFATEIRRTGPDSSGMYHHFLRLDAAPLGRLDLKLDSREAAPDYSASQATVPVQVASSTLHGFKLYQPAVVQQSLRFGRATFDTPYLVAYTHFITTGSSPVTWRTTVAIEHQSGTRWYPSKQAVSRRKHWRNPYDPTFSVIYVNLSDKLAAIRQAIRHGLRFRVVVTTTATSGGKTYHAQRAAYPWQPTTRPVCTVVMGAPYLCTFPPGITGG
jgi:hypothetical protein